MFFTVQLQKSGGKQQVTNCAREIMISFFKSNINCKISLYLSHYLSLYDLRVRRDWSPLVYPLPFTMRK